MDTLATTASRIAALLAPWADDDSAFSRDVRFHADLGMDALDEVLLAEEVEEEFDIEISDAELAEVVTLDDLITLVERKLAEREG
jgi:acyl carrier protein